MSARITIATFDTELGEQLAALTDGAEIITPVTPGCIGEHEALVVIGQLATGVYVFIDPSTLRDASIRALNVAAEHVVLLPDGEDWLCKRMAAGDAA